MPFQNKKRAPNTAKHSEHTVYCLTRTVIKTVFFCQPRSKISTKSLCDVDFLGLVHLSRKEKSAKKKR